MDMRLDSLIDTLPDPLQQQLPALPGLMAKQYRAPVRGHFKSGVGRHLRHGPDHCQTLFASVELSAGIGVAPLPLLHQSLTTFVSH